MPHNKKESKIEALEVPITEKLDEAYQMAEDYYNEDNDTIPPFASDNLSPEFIDALEKIADNCEKASSAYSNILTALSIKAVYGDEVDVRYHQMQIQKDTDRPAGFNLRSVSEHIIYSWMERHEFHGAKSGWQARTLERPKPYTLDYDENISMVKEPFLIIYDQIETHHQDALLALAFLMWRRIQLRNKSNLVLASPNIQDVRQITDLFESHFFYTYKNSKGASRLPVLALHSVYMVLLQELSRYAGKSLKPLEAHSAADAQTGAIGDIEVANQDGSVFEAVEVKHNLPVTTAIIDSVKQKIRGSHVDRYYILTTYAQHEPTEEIQHEADNVNRLLGCQLIVNGVIPSMRYYLRLLSNPGSVIPVYISELEEDSAVTFEHRDVWNKLATGMIPYHNV